MTDYFLPTSALIGTRAKTFVAYGGKVYSFKVNENLPVGIDGKRLEIRDGHLFANFDEFDMDKVEYHFPGCDRVGNSFDLGKVRT
jgi:hypothetical protein